MLTDPRDDDVNLAMAGRIAPRTVHSILFYISALIIAVSTMVSW